MKHFQDDGYYQMEDYEFSLMRHSDDRNINDDYDKPIGGFHDDGEDSWNDYEPTIKHFQDD